jgi:hypothetical protein
MDSILAVFVRFGIAFSLFFPLFFQLSGHIYHRPQPLMDSGGVLLNLPLPISMIGCFLGILFLGRYKSAFLSLAIVFLTFILMLCSSVISTQGHIACERQKLLLMIQFILPLCALFLGQIFGNRDNDQDIFVKAFLIVLILIVPNQLLYTWIKGEEILNHSVFVFSIYQSYQYVPLMMVSGFLIAFLCLWEEKKCRPIFYFLSPLIGIYAIASFSILTIFALLVGLLFISIFKFYKKGDKTVLVLYIVVLSVSTAYLYYCRQTDAYGIKFKAGIEKKIPQNVKDRFDDWKFYSQHIITNSNTLLFGHGRPPDRSVTTSAHNYYLDFIYNFGLIATIPLFILIGYTLILTFKFRHKIMNSNILLGLTGVVLYLILIDNNFKVTLRQPYPGIIIAFLWGIFLNKIMSLKGRTNDHK